MWILGAFLLTYSVSFNPFIFFFFVVSSSDQLNSEDSGSVPASLLEEQIRQRSSIVFNIDEDDYLVRNIYVKEFSCRY